ncbi:MAG: dTDP-glucose 4,6-dehydratase [Chloroflexota bacterium]
MEAMRRILVTGGMGFIGSALVRRLLAAHADVEVLNLDLLTYAAHPANLAELAREPRYRFVRGDVRDARLVRALAQGCWGVVHLAAETHVDRSLLDGSAFITANVLGTYVVLAAARDAGVQRVLVQSTDEVYGPTPEGVEVDEEAPLSPRSPYSASKLGAEMQARAFYCSFGLPVVIARPMNTIGPRQHPEKAVPLFTINALLGEPIPLYGDGLQERDRFYVEDHAAALDVLLHHGQPGEVYNVGSGRAVAVQEIVDTLLALARVPVRVEPDPALLRPVDVPVIVSDCSRLRAATGWAPQIPLEESVRAVLEYWRSVTLEKV